MTQRIAVLFPGQGAQQVGMGRLAVERFPQAGSVFERVDAALGISISSLCFQGPADRLQETRWQQPAIFACSLAILEAWRTAGDGVRAEILCAAGHSLGEYSALVAAGALALEDGARLVALRGQLMQEAADRYRGGMAAVLGLDLATVAAICDEASSPDDGLADIVVVANDNAPGQQVISGGLPALERATALARSRGARRVLPLKVAGAFHSPLMATAVEPLAAAIAATTFAPCTFPVIANSSCEPLRDPEAVRVELVRQVTAPVRWVESMGVLSSFAPEHWVDSGPGSVVAGLLARSVPEASALSLALSIDAATPT